MEVISVRLAEPAACGGDTVPTLVMWSCVQAKRKRSESASGATDTTIAVSVNATAPLLSLWISSDPTHGTGWACLEGVTITERGKSWIFGHSVCCDKRREEERSSQPAVVKPQRHSAQSDRATLQGSVCTLGNAELVRIIPFTLGSGLKYVASVAKRIFHIFSI